MSRRRQQPPSYGFEDDNGAEYAAQAAGYAVGTAVSTVSHAAEAAAGAAGLAAREAAHLSQKATSGLVSAEVALEHAAADAVHSMESFGRGAGQGLAEAEHAAAEGLKSFGSSMGNFFAKAAHTAGETAHIVADRAQHLTEDLAVGLESVEHSLEHGAQAVGSFARHEMEEHRRRRESLEAAALSAMKRAAEDLEYVAQHGAEALEMAVENTVQEVGHAVYEVNAEAHRISDAFNRGMSGKNHDMSGESLSPRSMKVERGHGSFSEHSESSTKGLGRHGHQGHKKSHGRKAPTPPSLPPQRTFPDDGDESPAAEVTTLHRGTVLRPGERRLRITVVGASRLPAGRSVGSALRCACEIRGRPQTRVDTETVDDCPDPMWNEQRELPYSLGDAVQLTVFRQERGADVRVGQATLSAAELQPHGFHGELPLGLGGAALQVCVSLPGTASNGGSPVSGGATAAAWGAPSTTGVPKGLAELGRARLPSEHRTEGAVVRTGPDVLYGSPACTGEVPRLKVSIRSARGMFVARARGASRAEQFYCVVGVLGRPLARCQTRASTGVGDPVWNSDHEVPDYRDGDGLEFLVVNARSPGDVVASAEIAPQQFAPYGFDSDVTLISPGQGISGLLRIKITVAGNAHRGAAPGVRVGQESVQHTSIGLRGDSLLVSRSSSRHRLLSEGTAISRATTPPRLGGCLGPCRGAPPAMLASGTSGLLRPPIVREPSLPRHLGGALPARPTSPVARVLSPQAVRPLSPMHFGFMGRAPVAAPMLTAAFQPQLRSPIAAGFPVMASPCFHGTQAVAPAPFPQRLGWHYLVAAR